MEKTQSSDTKVWVARILIGLVTFFNLQAAILFLVSPQNYAQGFALSGSAGNSMIQGMGLLFVMWNVPYVFALINPLKHRLSLIEAMIMQAIGVAGESVLLLLLPGSHPVIYASVVRFILFDGGGLVVLIVAFLISARRTA